MKGKTLERNEQKAHAANQAGLSGVLKVQTSSQPLKGVSQSAIWILRAELRKVVCSTSGLQEDFLVQDCESASSFETTYAKKHCKREINLHGEMCVIPLINRQEC